MSHDRGLPKPPALYYDYLGRDSPAGVLAPSTHRQLAPARLDAWGVNSLSQNASPMSGLEAISRAAMSHRENDISVLSKAQAPMMSSRGETVLAAPVPRKKSASIITPEEPRQKRATSSSSSESSSSRESNVQFCLCGPEPRIPRPRNAFILFRQHWQCSVVAEHPGLPNPDISKIIGKMWKTLSPEDQEPWKKHADEEKVRHQQKYPGYRYQPRRPGRNKRKSANVVASTTKIDSSGESVCSRCGGKPMRPPSTPSTPFIPCVDEQACSSGHPEDLELARRIQGSQQIKIESAPSPSSASYEAEWGVNAPRDNRIVLLPPCPKRRRCEMGEIYPPARERISRETPFSLRTLNLPRAELVQHIYSTNYLMSPRSQYSSSMPPSPHDPSLVLPPIKLPNQSCSQSVPNIDELSTIPVLKKINILSRGSPPFRTYSSPDSEDLGGAVVAIESQNPELVTHVIKYLKDVLFYNDGGNVQIFEGPDADVPDSSDNTRAAAGNFLKKILSWYKISSTILTFLTNGSPQRAEPIPCDHKSKFCSSLSSIIPKTEELNISSPGQDAPIKRSHSSLSSETDSGKLSLRDAAFRIALVPRYQLSTTEAHASSSQTTVSQDLDQWERMATQWASCVGPDITIYIHECDQEEMGRYDEKNPVENRLNDAQTLLVRCPLKSSEGIDEKTLRRIGFEIKEFLKR